MNDLNPGTLVVPSGLPNLSPLSLDVGEINEVESRIQEIAFVTPVKAPELLSVFNKAYGDLVQMISGVQFQFELAKQHMNKVRAIVLLDKVPQILKDRGLASAKSPMGSEDLRQAILDTDQEYIDAQQNVFQIKCILMLLEGKQQTIDKAYTAVKKVYADPSQYRHSQSHATEPNSEENSFFRKSGGY